MIYDSYCMTFGKGETIEKQQKDQWLSGVERKSEMNRRSGKDF